MNTFGHADSRQFLLCDQREVLYDRQRFRREALPVLERANTFYCPSGRWPCRGWVLLPRAEYAQVDPYSRALQLNIGNTGRVGNVGPLNNLSVVQAQCVTRGLATDPAALYLIELTDARGVLHNGWFSFPLTAQYNIRSPAYPDTFQLESMRDYPAAGPDSKTTWTWSSMLQDIWGTMGAFLGPWPGLPYAPVGTPEGFWFTGTPAWTALCDVLDHLGMTVACDLTSADPYTIVQLGAADAAFTARQSLYATNLEDDHEDIDLGAGRVPLTVVVLFRRRNAVYGTEETVTYRNDGMAEQWDTGAVYAVSVAAPAVFSGASGTGYLWSDFTVGVDMDGDPLPGDVGTASSIAQERVQAVFGKIYRQTLGTMTQTYAGALPFATGPQVDGVRWYMDFTDDDWVGWRTQVVRGDDPPWPGLWGEGAQC